MVLMIGISGVVEAQNSNELHSTQVKAEMLEEQLVDAEMKILR